MSGSKNTVDGRIKILACAGISSKVEKLSLMLKAQTKKEAADKNTSGAGIFLLPCGGVQIAGDIELFR